MKRVARNALALFLISWATAHAGAWLGRRFVPRGDGYPKAGEIQSDFFRFDSAYYLDIAENGYSYDGDPGGSPNIVFAPLFPRSADALAYLPGFDAVRAGFALNAVLLFAAFFCLTLTLEAYLSPRATFTVLAALGTSAGGYALHAYYAEATMFAALAFALLAAEKRWSLALGLASAALGASRLAALPMSLAFTLLLVGRRSFAALLAPMGSVLYLGYIAFAYGEPFSLLREIQGVSWGRFHPPTDWVALATGRYLFTYLSAAIDKGWNTFTDIQTLNLAWLLLALASVLVVRTRLARLLAPAFVPYVLFVYASSTSSPFLISVHRFCVVLVPLFALGALLHAWLARRAHPALAYAVSGGLLALNLAYGLLHAALFNQGHWFWF